MKAAPLLLVTLATASPGPALGQDHDLQQWTLLATQGPLSDKLVAYAEIQPRITDDASRLGQLLIRPAIGYRVNKNLTAFLGYAYVRTEPLGGRATDEHRLFQQLSFAIYRAAGGFEITARTRLEQRSVVGADDLGWRFRQVIRAEGPVAHGSKLRAIAWTEPFVNLDTTDWGQRSGIDQWRTFIGLGLPITDRLRAEPGYLNQTVFLRGGDRVNHVLSLTLFHRF
jgi:hypothetical protein